MKEKLIDLIKTSIELAKSQAKSLAPAFGVTLAIVLFVVVAADLLYQPKSMIKRGYKIVFSKDGNPVVKVQKPVNIEELMKFADAKNGEKLFRKCASCHSSQRDGGNKVGPNLFGIVGKARATTSGFAYSDAMKAKGGRWDRKSISEFITKPRDYVPGTKMAFAGLRKPKDRADVIAYLEKQR